MAADEPHVEKAPGEAASGAQQLSSYPARPRLRLHQLFALTAVMAVMLAIGGPGVDFGSWVPPRLVQVAIVAARIIYTILAAVAITVVAYGVAWRRQGFVFFNEPGHWLLVTIAASQLLFVIPALLERVLAMIQEQAYGMNPVMGGALTAWLIPGVIMLALNIYLGRTKCVERHWARVFYAKGAAALVPAIGDLIVLLFLDRSVRAENPRGRRMRFSNHPRGYVPPMAAGYGQRRSRDAAHWCGVVVQFALTGLTLVMMAVVFFSVFLVAFWT